MRYSGSIVDLLLLLYTSIYLEELDNPGSDDYFILSE